jgi:hypothetical protein
MSWIHPTLFGLVARLDAMAERGQAGEHRPPRFCAFRRNHQSDLAHVTCEMMSVNFSGFGKDVAHSAKLCEKRPWRGLALILWPFKHIRWREFSRQPMDHWLVTPRHDPLLRNFSTIADTFSGRCEPVLMRFEMRNRANHQDMQH